MRSFASSKRRTSEDNADTKLAGGSRRKAQTPPKLPPVAPPVTKIAHSIAAKNAVEGLSQREAKAANGCRTSRRDAVKATRGRCVKAMQPFFAGAQGVPDSPPPQILAGDANDPGFR